MSKNDIRVIVPGGLNTDIIGLGVDTIVGAGELTLGGKLEIGPGGKARNMAQMAAAYLGKNKVAMLGRTAKDPYGFWKAPVESLVKAGVDTRYVRKMPFKGTFPGIALIPVDKKGRNQIYVLPGVNAAFGRSDIDDAAPLFRRAAAGAVMVLALEIPLPTVKSGIAAAYKNGIRVVLDPGGMAGDISALLNRKLYLLKPNEHEAKMITGIAISGLASAAKAGAKILKTGVANVFITHGAKGGYLVTPEGAEHIPIPAVKKGKTRDETGCGDQVTAVTAAGLASGLPLAEAVRRAVKAGTLQFYRSGIKPVTKKELDRA